MNFADPLIVTVVNTFIIKLNYTFIFLSQQVRSRNNFLSAAKKR